MKYDCLIVDDEELLAVSTCEYFNMFDIMTYWVPDAKTCLDFLQKNETELILLDINLGSSSGFELCKKLRKETNVPILFISARSSDDDMLLALNIGGDDYIRKPYSLSVLLAKVKAVLKRYSNKNESEVFVSDRFTLDFHLGRVMLNGKAVQLKTMEYKLLVYLVRNKNRVVPKEELFNNVWGDIFTGDGTLNVHIRHLREKLEENPEEPRYIKTIWGTGYIFMEDKP